MNDENPEAALICQWIDQDSTILVRQYDDGTLEVATRGDAGELWGPPVLLELDA